MKCTELIKQDHVVLRRGLNILGRMVQIMEDGDRIEILDIRTILKFLRLFGDAYHQSMEENVLFPILLRAAPQKNLIHQMVLEHGEERELVAAIEASLNPKHGIGFVRCSSRLIQLLRNHLDIEDTELCGIAEQLLSSEEDEAIVAEFAFNRNQTETDETLARLERKYAPRPRRVPIELDRRAHA